MSTNSKIVRRKEKREREIKLIVKEISDFLNNNIGSLNILEFGCGAGYQTPYIQTLGNVIATDIYKHENIANIKNINFVQTSILNTQFKDKEFDLLFSNHVIEHIHDISAAFKELKRIGKDDALYVFSVPTNIWLLLSIPAQLNSKSRHLLSKLLPKQVGNEIKKSSLRNNGAESKSILKQLALSGHGGVYTEFFDCYNHFKIKTWKKLFIDNDFLIVHTKPLLLYSPAEFPFIPTIKPFKNICSSILFILKDKKR